MRIVKYPVRVDSACANMAIDSWMLTQITDVLPVAFRSYQWLRPSFTFGYTQRLSEVLDRIQLIDVDLCRRPSGGGIVDHRNDWTYSIAVSSRSLWGEMKPLEFYKEIHSALVSAFLDFEFETELFQPIANEINPLACFDRPSPYDVVLKDTTEKVAGAALKRTRDGILLQGTVDRSVCSSIEFVKLEKCFLTHLSNAAQVNEVQVECALPHGSELDAMVVPFESESWQNKR